MKDLITKAKFLFDLNGYVIIRNVLSAQEIQDANTAISAHGFHERKTTPDMSELGLTKANTPYAGTINKGRLEVGGMIGWDKPYREIFRKFLVHPNLVPYLHAFVGKGYRMDHNPLVIAQEKGVEGHSLHGGSIEPDGFYNSKLTYECKNGQILNSLVAASFFLTDQNEEDGGFCVVRGSHKINLPPTEAMLTGDDPEFMNSVYQPIGKAGDVVIFSEATIHGCLPWRADRQRRIALYRFAPGNFAYSRQYDEGWPETYTEGMTPEQLAVMRPPYSTRYDRQILNDDGSLGQV